MKSIKYLLGVIGALLAGIWYLFVKGKSAEALNENNDVHKEANKLDQQAFKNEGLLQAEEEIRSNLEKQKTEKNHEDSVDYFNERNKK